MSDVETPCPDENVLVAYVERTIQGDERRAIEAHLDSCPRCFVVTCELARTEDEPPMSSTLPQAASPGGLESPAPGTRIGRYRLLRFLGQGGMGSVYAAHDSQLDRTVALKLLRFERAGATDARARLLREARAMAKLAHPNVVTVYDAGEVDDHTFIAMEFVEGKTLGAWLREEARPWDQALEVVLKAGQGLSAAHAAGIVHRDFKPENVLIDRQGRVAVGDFGLAAVPQTESHGADPPSERLSHRWGAAVTRTGTVLGTPRYMSPEQYAGARVDARSDQFSFAVTAYEALFGERPFSGETLDDIQAAVRENRVREAPVACRVPAEVRRALLRGMAKDSGDRYPSLDELLGDLSSATVVNKGDHAAPSLARPKGRRLFGGLVAVSLVGAVAAAASGWLRDLHPRTASLPGPAATAPLLGAGARADVVMAGVENETGSPLFDGSLEAVLDAALYPSTKIHSYAGFAVTELAAEVQPEAKALDETLAKRLASARSTPVLLLRGSVAASGDAYTITIRVTDAATGVVVFDAAETPPSLSEIVPATVRLALRLRASLGDPPADGDADGVMLPSSVEVIHEWNTARDLRTGGDGAAALIHATRAVTLDPDFGEGHAERGRDLYVLNQTPEAVSEYDLALSSKDAVCSRERLVLVGDRSAALSQHVEAIAAYEQVSSKWPGDERLAITMTRQASRAQNWSLAIELARQAIADHPRSPGLERILVSAYLNDNRVEDAARQASEALSHLSRAPSELIVNAAVAETLLGHTARANELYDQLAKEDPEYADEARADLAMYEGRLDDAEALLQHWIDDALRRHDPGLARTEYIALTQLLLRRGDTTGAATAAGSAASGSKTEAAIWNRYAIASGLVESGLDKRAFDLSRGWKAGPSSLSKVYARLIEGDVARAHGRLRDALRIYQDAAQILDLWVVHRKLGDAYLALSSWADAEREFSTCVERRGQGALEYTPGLHDLSPALLGLARAKEGRSSPDAAAAYEAFLALEPRAQHDPLAEEARRRLDALRSRAASKPKAPPP